MLRTRLNLNSADWGACKAGDAHNRIAGCTGLRLSLTCTTGTLAWLLHRVPYFYTSSRNLLLYIGKNTLMSCQGTRIDQESNLAQHMTCRKPGNKSTYKTSMLHVSRQNSDLITRPLVERLRATTTKSKADQPHSKTWLRTQIDYRISPSVVTHM